jgi:hypothetical protein
LLARFASKSGDRERALTYLQRAEPLADHGPEPFSFELAGAYLAADPKPDDERKQKLLLLLNRFVKRACRGSLASEFKDQCSVASTLLDRLAP